MSEYEIHPEGMNDGLWENYKQALVERDKAVEVLEDCEKALERLPDDCLGFNRTRDGKYPFKDELLSKVQNTLSEIGGDCDD